MNATNTATAGTPRTQAGYVLVPIIAVVMTITILATILSQTSAGASQRVEFEVQDARLDAIAEAAIDLTLQDLWSRYQRSLGDAPNNLSAFQTFLTAEGIGVQAYREGSAGEFDMFGNAVSDSEAWADVLSSSSLKRGKAGYRTLLGAHVHRVEILRQDTSGALALRARAVVSFGRQESGRLTREVERLYFAGGEKFTGFGFALLANNVNCIMCHATFDSAERYYNRDDTLRGSFQRVRVGTMESLKIRANSANSIVAGTIYTRGPVMDKDGSLLGGLAGTSLVSTTFDENRNLVEDWTGDLDPTNFINAAGDPLPAGANLYMNYPTDSAAQPDGGMPASFPPVIPDENGNRLVDADEFLAEAAKANGTLTGGTKVRVPLTGNYGHDALPDSSNLNTVNGTLDGHLVAYGTLANPIRIDGRITIDGDLVIGGVVKGSGEIIARNNTYIVGNLVYNDAYEGLKRVFGKASDGTPNRLTLGAGGNILVGDYLSTKKGAAITGEVDGDFNFTLSETTIFGQMEWVRTQPTVPASEGSSTMVPNPVYDPNHVPRYYVIRPENPVGIYNKEDTYFDVDTRTWLGKEHLGKWDLDLLTVLPVGDAQRAKAAVIALNPEQAWLSETQLMAMWEQCEDAHAGGPLLVDAFLYTNNGIMMMARKSSAYGGQVLMNGGLVGADLGILVAGGLRLNYDARHDGAIQLRESGKNQISLLRGARLR